MDNKTQHKSLTQITVKHFDVVVVAMLIAFVFLVLPTAATKGFDYVAVEYLKPYQEANYPVLGEKEVYNPASNELETWPPFVIDNMWFEGEDLYLRGRMCKVQPYKFVKISMLFGTPQGPSKDAGSAWHDRGDTKQVNRDAVCQYWGDWVLLKAEKPPLPTFYIRVKHLPSHNLYEVVYYMGPFIIPEKTPDNTGDPFVNKHVLSSNFGQKQ